MKKKSLIFALGGVLLDKNYGARRIDANGLNDILAESHDSQLISDDLSGLDPKDFYSINIIPKNAHLFDSMKGINKVRETQYDFIDRIKQLSLDERPRINMYFNDIKIGLHGSYNFEDDIFGDLVFNCIYDFDSDDKVKARDIFVDEIYQKHISRELETRWIVAAHLDNVISKQFADFNYRTGTGAIAISSPTNSTTQRVNRLYYGDYREGIVDSLKFLGMGNGHNDLIIGSKELANQLGNVNCIEDKMPMDKVKNYIANANYNLLPYEENKTNRQITARILELGIFGNGFSNVLADRWNFVNMYKELDKDKLIRLFISIARKSSEEINQFINE